MLYLIASNTFTYFHSIRKRYRTHDLRSALDMFARSCNLDTDRRRSTGKPTAINIGASESPLIRIIEYNG